jgi:hypothetical protein
MDNYLSEIEQRKAATAKALQSQSVINEIFGGSQKQAMPQSAFYQAADGYGPAAPQSARPTRTGGIGGLSIDDVTRLKMAGLDVMKEFEWANNPQKFDQGATYENRITGKREFMPKISEGIGPDGSGGFAPVRGYAASLAEIEGAKARAVEAARAGFDPVTITPAGSTNPVMTSRAQLMGGAQPPTQTGNGYAGGSASAAASGQREILLQELRKPNLLAEDKSALMRELSRLGGAPAQSGAASSPVGGIRLQSPSEAAQLLDQIKADIEPTKQKQATIDSAMNAFKLVDKALTHPGLATSTGLSGTLDPRNYIPGTDAKNYQSIQKQLQGSAFLSAFASLKGGGQITEVEGAKAEAAIARLQTAQSTEEYKSALKDYQEVIGQGLKRYGVDVGGQEQKSTTPANLIPELPKMAAVGTRAKDHTTGKIMRFDGMKWKEE